MLEENCNFFKALDKSASGKFIYPDFGVCQIEDDKSLSKTCSPIAEVYGTLPGLEKNDNMTHLFGDEQRPEWFRNFDAARMALLLDQIETCSALYLMNTPYSKMVIKLTDQGVRIRLKKRGGLCQRLHIKRCMSSWHGT